MWYYTLSHPPVTLKKTNGISKKSECRLTPAKEKTILYFVKGKTDSFHIIVALNFSRADNRLRLSGALRFLSAEPGFDIRILDTSQSSIASEIKRMTTKWSVDGIICTMIPTMIPKRSLSLLSTKRGKHRRPLIAMLDGPRTFNDADINIRLNGKEVTDAVYRLLQRRGFNNFAFCGTERPQDIQYSEETELCFRNSVPTETWTSSFHENADLSYSQNMYLGAKWAAGLPKPCGIMCYSDVLARELLTACSLAHINVPEQIAIVGMDDTPEICEMTRPTLTSALPDFEQSGYLAAKAICEALRSGHRSKKVFAYGLKTIVERESTQDLRRGGHYVTAACKLMRSSKPESLSAEAIAKSLNLSRRLLEMHFKDILGRGIHAEITRVRLEIIRRRLLETSTPIGTISLECGFNSLAAVQIAFKKLYGTSMRDYRHSHGHQSNQT